MGKNKKKRYLSKKNYKKKNLPNESSSDLELCIDCFGSPFKCPKHASTPRYPSPNSPLEQEALDQLQHCIETANNLLRSLGTDSDANNRRQLQLHFLELQGALVKVKISCDRTEPDEEPHENEGLELEIGEEIEAKLLQKKGVLATAGRDFLQINPTGSFVFIFYEKLISITREESENSRMHKPEFIDANTVTRRNLALNFGEFVSKHPDIVNLFFGLPLHKQLHKYLGKDININTSEHPTLLNGTFIHVDEGKVQIENRNGTS